MGVSILLSRIWRVMTFAAVPLLGLPALADPPPKEIIAKLQGEMLPRPLDGWLASPRFKQGDRQAQFFLRQLDLGAGQIRPLVGSVFVSSGPKTEGETAQTAVTAWKDWVSKGLGISEKPHLRKLGDAHVLEIHWKAKRRYLRIMTRDSGKIRAQAVAMFRDSMPADLAVETELLQRATMGVLGVQPNQKTSFLNWMEWFLPNALAQSNGSCFDRCQPGPMQWICISQCSVTDLSSAANGLSDAARGLSDSGTRIADAAEGLQESARGVGTDISAVRERAESFFDTMEGQARRALDLADARSREALRLADRRSGQYLDEFEQMNDTLASANAFTQRFLSPEYAFGFAMASAAGAALGAGIMGIAMDAVVSGATALWQFIEEAITGEADQRRSLERFREAMDRWNEQSEAIARMERAVDATLVLYELGRGTWGRSARETEVLLRTRLLGLQRQRARIEQRLLEEEQGENRAECVGQWLYVMADQDRQIQDLEDSIARIRQHERERDLGESRAAICGQLRNDLDELLRAQAAIEQSRVALMSRFYAWNRFQFDQWGQAMEDARRIRERPPADAQAYRRQAEQIFQSAYEELEEAMEAEVSDCVNRGGSRADCWIQLGSTPRGRQLTRRRDEMRAGLARMRESRDTLTTFQIEQSLNMVVNFDLQSRAMTAYDRWHMRLAAEESCLQQTTATCRVQLRDMNNEPYTAILNNPREWIRARNARVDQMCAEEP